MGEKWAAGFASQSEPLLPAMDSSSDEQRPAALREVRRRVRAAFAGSDAYHGLAHAQAVAQHATATARHVGSEFTPFELLALETAALLHDVGYSAYQPTWDANRRQHVQASLDFTTHTLRNIQFFARHPPLILVVSYLIGYHDDTSYKFPSAVWQGGVNMVELGPYEKSLSEFDAGLPKSQHCRLRLLLGLLREADALSAAGPSGASRTFSYSAGRGLPIFARGNALDAWCWEESAVGNTRLAAKRALIDACTRDGRRRARESYRATEAYVEAICVREGVAYVQEDIASVLDGTSVLDPAVGTTLDIVRYVPWPRLERALRSPPTCLWSEDSAAKRIALRRMPIADLLVDMNTPPDARVDDIAGLEKSLQAEYVLSLFDLAAEVTLRWHKRQYRLAPPVLGAMEPRGAEPYVDLSGALRIALARKLAVDALWVADSNSTNSGYA